MNTPATKAPSTDSTPATAAAAPRDNKGMIGLSLMITGLGIAWLFTSLAVGPNIDWVWTIGLAITGIVVVFVSGGIDKLSLVLGPFFWCSSVLSVFRQTGQLRLEVEMPILVIVLGVLLPIAQLSVIPVPRWLVDPTQR